MMQEYFFKRKKDMLNFLLRQGYSEDTINLVSLMILTTPKKERFKMLEHYMSIAKSGLSEQDFLNKIGQMFKEIIMG